MSIENSRSNSIDGQWVRDNETKEFEYDYSKSEDAKSTYEIIVETLAQNKINNDLLFKGMVDAQVRLFERAGITISREQLMTDINKEVARQLVNIELENDIKSSVQQQQMKSDVDSDIARLKNNLGSFFEPSISTRTANKYS